MGIKVQPLKSYLCQMIINLILLFYQLLESPQNSLL